ncbi:MAG: hypothetical protein ABIO29_01590 [Sphingomicrobium sp.]
MRHHWPTMDPAARLHRSTMAPWLILGLCALIALVGQALFIPVDADVSWLITVSERVLAGQRLYVDVFEVNPPASVWLYLPQVALAHSLGLRPEAMIVGIAIMLALLSSALTLRLARRLAEPPPSVIFAAALGFVTLILPAGLFAQREHVALLLALPLSVLLALVAERRAITLRAAVAAGVASGLIMVIKPHFVLAVATPALLALWRSRAWRQFAIAVAAAAAVVALYALAIWWFAPAYLERLDMLAELYIPMRERWARLLAGPVVLFPAALAMLLLWLRRSRPRTLATMLALAALGFTIAALIQGKGYWNHALPAVALLIVAVAIEALAAPADRRRLTYIALASIALGSVASTARIGPPPGLVATLRSVAPANPTMITLGTELATGHPAVRLVDGRWVGSRAALFTAAGVRYRAAGGRRRPSASLERWYREDLNVLASEIAANRPDVILVEIEDLPWLGREPEVRPLLVDYRRAARAGTIEIWIRRGQ